MDYAKTIAKALTGALIAGGAVLSANWTDGAISGPDVLGAVLAGLAALAAVYAVPNKTSN